MSHTKNFQSKYLILLFIYLFSCSKQPEPAIEHPLNGTWRLIETGSPTDPNNVSAVNNGYFLRFQSNGEVRAVCRNYEELLDNGIVKGLCWQVNTASITGTYLVEEDNNYNKVFIELNEDVPNIDSSDGRSRNYIFYFEEGFLFLLNESCDEGCYDKFGQVLPID